MFYMAKTRPIIAVNYKHFNQITSFELNNFSRCKINRKTVVGISQEWQNYRIFHLLQYFGINDGIKKRLFVCV